MRTKEEYEAAAMLLGMWYDASDHTFNEDDAAYGNWKSSIDADTLELVYSNHEGEDDVEGISERRQRVRDGKLGLGPAKLPSREEARNEK